MGLARSATTSRSACDGRHARRLAVALSDVATLNFMPLFRPARRRLLTSAIERTRPLLQNNASCLFMSNRMRNPQSAAAVDQRATAELRRRASSVVGSFDDADRIEAVGQQVGAGGKTAITSGVGLPRGLRSLTVVGGSFAELVGTRATRRQDCSTTSGVGINNLVIDSLSLASFEAVGINTLEAMIRPAGLGLPGRRLPRSSPTELAIAPRLLHPTGTFH